MASKILQRAEAIKTYLNNIRDRPNFEEESAAQAEAIAAELSRLRLTASTVLKVVAQIHATAWATEDQKATVLAALEGTAAERKQQQNYENLVFFLKERQWARLLDEDIDSNTKMHLILDAAIDMGLRRYQESTTHRFTVLYTLCCEGAEKALSLDYEYLDTTPDISLGYSHRHWITNSK